MKKLFLACISVSILWQLSLPLIAQDWVYTTRPGDTLWDISAKYLKSVNDWQKLKKYNSVNIPKQLSPGIRIRIPVAWLKYKPQGVEILFFNGEISVVDSDGKIRSIKVGDELQIGDTIQSHDNASATLRFADGSTLLLLSNSELILDSLSAYQDTGMVDTHLRLQRGRVETKVIPLQDNKSRYQIITPAAVASVRGTVYRVNVDSETNTMRAEVLEGQVAVANKRAEQAVDGGFGTLAEQNKPPVKPRQLLGKPDISTIPSILTSMPATLDWAKMELASAYRVQVLSAGNKDEVLFDYQRTDPSLTINQLAAGAYQLRVRAIDDIGLEGLDAMTEFVVDDRLKKPLTEPVMDEEIIQDTNLILSWRPVVHATAYHLQVATDKDFATLIVDEVIPQTTYTLTIDKEVHRYYYRVKSVSKQHEPGEFSRITRVDI